MALLTEQWHAHFYVALWGVDLPWRCGAVVDLGDDVDTADDNGGECREEDNSDDHARPSVGTHSGGRLHAGLSQWIG